MKDYYRPSQVHDKLPTLGKVQHSITVSHLRETGNSTKKDPTRVPLSTSTATPDTDHTTGRYKANEVSDLHNCTIAYNIPLLHRSLKKLSSQSKLNMILTAWNYGGSLQSRQPCHRSTKTKKNHQHPSTNFINSTTSPYNQPNLSTA